MCRCVTQRSSALPQDRTRTPCRCRAAAQASLPWPVAEMSTCRILVSGRLTPKPEDARHHGKLDAIVSMVSLGMGITVVPRPRQPLLTAYALRQVDLGKKAPSRLISLVWRKTDEGSRNIAALAEAFAETFKHRDFNDAAGLG